MYTTKNKEIMIRKLRILLLFATVSVFTACDEDGGINFFTLDQDIAFGKQMDSVILANPSEYSILSEAQYQASYEHINRIRNAVLASDDLKYKDRFPWQVRIIHNDEVLNAFAAPGGYLYFYTGLIKYLDNEAQLAGVMAHEIAHADKRHSTETMTKMYGFSTLLQIVLGQNPSALEQILSELALGATNLKFSRNHEYEADEFAVRYLYDTTYDPKGVAGFFEKLMDEGQRPKIPEFLSTHPDPGNRVEAINKVWISLGSKQGEAYSDRYMQFKNTLP